MCAMLCALLQRTYGFACFTERRYSQKVSQDRDAWKTELQGLIRAAHGAQDRLQKGSVVSVKVGLRLLITDSSHASVESGASTTPIQSNAWPKREAPLAGALAR